KNKPSRPRPLDGLPRRNWCAIVVPGDKNRDRGGWYWDGHAIDWLGNGRGRDEDVDSLFEGESLRLSLHFAQLWLRRRNYILTRISQGRCAKCQRNQRDAASPRPTGQAGQPEPCFHTSIMRQVSMKYNGDRANFFGFIA